jgi:hypothetical protein
VLHVNHPPAVFRHRSEERDETLLYFLWDAALFPDVGVATPAAYFERVRQRFNPSAWALEREGLLCHDSHPAAAY